MEGFWGFPSLVSSGEIVLLCRVEWVWVIELLEYFLFWERLASRILETPFLNKNLIYPQKFSILPPVHIKYGIREVTMTKENTKTNVGSRMDSMEEVVGMLNGELGELKGEIANLKEYLQQILKNQ